MRRILVPTDFYSTAEKTTDFPEKFHQSHVSRYNTTLMVIPSSYQYRDDKTSTSNVEKRLQ